MCTSEDVSGTVSATDASRLSNFAKDNLYWSSYLETRSGQHWLANRNGALEK